MPEYSTLAAGAAGAIPFACGRDFDQSPENSSHNGRPAESAVAACNGAPPVEEGAQKRPARKQPDPAKVLGSFNTWSFKREQPADPSLMLRIISESIAIGAPVPFLLYWGKGPRCTIAQPDIECLDYLAAFARRVQGAYEPGAAVKLIFTDTHAELNGFSQASIRQYFGEIEDAARQRGFDSCWLGAITRAADTAASGLADGDVPQGMIMLLAASAKKWYRGEWTCEQGALKYYRMNMVERRAVELAFPSSIFITFNGSKLRGLFPERLPIFYMYSLRRGVAVKPWFLPVDNLPRGDSYPERAVPQLQEG